ncbi:DUF3352 domain-containing protein [Stieleria sp. JC731]|uniref:DUF3352 domain-containing protein n=1 Tax=Pirellulaceae TaxID=2691357 RepID=UPI001E59E47A|nr:DUF3352 domain-containing protein [Stieleria sp. JC731]MCC9601627.1 DUF3352 domain-containing protein [Stieleria sp. JC731]
MSTIRARDGSLRFAPYMKQTLAAVFLTTVGLAVGMPSAPAAENDSSDSLPGAPRLFPSDSLAYIRLDNAADLRKDMKKSSLGMMINDPKMRPFADEFYATLKDLFQQVSDEIGIGLDELLDIPQGQVAIAIHPAKPLEGDEKPELTFDDDADESEIQRRKKRQELREQYSFGFTFIVDAGENIDSLMKIVDRFERELTKQRVRRVVKIDGTEVKRMLPNRAGRLPIEFFERDGTFVIGVGNSAAQDVLNHWIGKSDEPTLAENATFGTIISRCVGAEETRPQLTFFIDPHAIADRIIKRSDSITVALLWPSIEDLGVARIGGIGGSSFRGGDVFESIAHWHIKIDPPRDGLLGVLRPETGVTAPPDWVPEKVVTYTSLNWDFAKAYENFGKVLDRFQGADALKRFVEDPVSTRIGISVQDDVLGNFTGRFVRLVWMEPPMRINSGVNVFAFELKDAAKAKSDLAEVRDRMQRGLNVETIAGHVVYRMRGPGQNFPKNLRRPEPSFLVLDKWLIYCDSTDFIEKVALAQAGKLPRLVDLPEYSLVSGELGGKLDGDEPFMLSFIDGAEGMRMIYDLAKDQNSRNFLRSAGENNVVARKFSELMDRNELPPFSELEKYFAPTGSFGYNEPDGIHFGFFSLRPDPETN